MKLKKVDLIEVPFGIAGISLATGIVGTKFNSPGLQQASTTSSKLIAPAINISVGGYLVNKLRTLKK